MDQWEELMMVCKQDLTIITIHLFDVGNRSALPLSFMVLFKIFLLSLVGITLSVDLYNVGLDYTSANVASATSNTVPVITFFLALVLRIKDGTGVRRKARGTLLPHATRGSSCLRQCASCADKAAWRVPCPTTVGIRQVPTEDHNQQSPKPSEFTTHQKFWDDCGAKGVPDTKKPGRCGEAEKGKEETPEDGTKTWRGEGHLLASPLDAQRQGVRCHCSCCRIRLQ
ncbi:hypothetical protein Taro_025725 [Colocasia esculenta]|uniref:WAT1-related protein n=1 Tax=Colocasia esculenta TaxID=4460 RepID=A0A843V9L4_COLES|nr:hypothetical protein [Colocasia esculenta]